MAMRVPQYERRQVASVQQPVGVTPRQSGFGEVARGVADVGQMFDQWQADVDEADAKAADTAYSDMVRKTLYEDQTGYLYQQGGSALAQRQAAAETLQKAYDETIAKLSPNARQMAQASMESRRQSALTSVDRHAGGERITYLNGQGDARIKGAIDDAILDPANIGRSLSISRSEIADTGARMGWSPEQVAQKQAEAEGAIHDGIVRRLANVDPQAALDYLNGHRDSMAAGDVARLEGALVPEAKRRRGREAGRQLAMQGMGGSIPESYYANAKAAESGGRGDAKNPNSSARGFFQWTDGTWANMVQKHPDLDLTMDGRGNAAQEERAMRRFTEENAAMLIRGGVAISNGTLYAAHFLGAGGALKVLRAPLAASVASIVGEGVVRANSFLRGMNVSDFIAWAERKGGGAGPEASVPQPQGNPMWSILQMEDPDERAAAMQEYQLWSGQVAAQQKAAQDAAQTAGFALIEQGGDIDSLTLDQKLAIGQSGMSSLRSYQATVNSGTPIETEPELFVELSRQAATDPQAFAARDPLEWRNRLSDSDFKSFVQKQADAMKGADPEKGLTISTINTVTSDILTAAGIDSKDKSGAQKTARFQESLLRWSASYQQANNRQPSHLELREQANAMLLPIMVDAPGMGNNRGEGNLFEFDFDEVIPSDLTSGGLKIGDDWIEPSVVEEFVVAFTEAVGRAPTPQEVVEGLALANAP